MNGASNAQTLLDLVDITKRYGELLANRRAHLNVVEGEIHALLGENGAGKTTLMRVLFGLTHADGGQILWRGKKVSINSPKDAFDLGIGMVHQHDMLVPTFSLAENFELARREGGFRLRTTQSARQLKELSAAFSVKVRTDARAEEVTVGQRQWVSLLRVLRQQVRLLVMDEPTTSLTPQERELLFASLGHLRSDGVSVIFITHKLEEVLSLADRVSVMRRGETIATERVGDTSKETLARLMVGQALNDSPVREAKRTQRALLEVEGLGLGRDIHHLADVSLKVHEGEIVGIAGVDGNGQRELLECLFGLRLPTAGRILLGDREITGTSPSSFIVAGVARIPEDRHAYGLALEMAIWENLHLGRMHVRGLLRAGLLRIARARELARTLAARFDVRASSIHQRSNELSGGNQQKVVIARELADDPKLVVAMNPTRGLDIGATRYVHEQLSQVRSRGGGVLFVSFDLDEIRSLSDRILVMSDGRITGEFTPSTYDDTSIGLLMGGEVRSASFA